VLSKAMDRSQSLARALGVLKVDGGRMSRQAYVAIYGDLVKELQIGVFISIGGAAGGTAAAPAASVRQGDRLFNRSQVEYLADLQEFDVKSGEWPFTKDGTTGNKDPIKVHRNLSPKGLGMHPPANPAVASVKYHLGKQAAVFKTVVAINDTATFCWTPAIFSVWGDGKELFSSKNIAHNHFRTEECTVDVSGVDVLELRVRTIGLNTGVHAVWVEPRVLQRADSKDIPWPFSKKLFETGPRDYLSDLSEKVLKTGPWEFGKNGNVGQDGSICLNGVKSPKGLGMHPPMKGYSAVRYQLEKKATLFKGAVGIDDSAQVVWGAAVFEVYGDGKRLWQSGQFTKPKQQPAEFTIDVSGVNELELRVVAQGTNHGLHAVWIEPRLLQAKDTPDK
jgi:hypothetical protein